MAAVSLSTITGALATIFEDRVVHQFNRSTVLLQLLPFAPGISQNLVWDATLDGSVADSSFADGADVATYNDDVLIQPTLSWGTYSEAFAITGKALAAAAITGNPAQLAALFAEKMDNAVTRLARNLNLHAFSGTGGNQMVGLTASGGGLKATGVYATIDRGVGANALWKGNELGNGGVARALSVGLMRDMRVKIFNACGEMPDLIVCDATQQENYGNLLASNRRYMQEVYLRGQKIVLDGGYRALDFDGIPVIADPNCPAGTMAFVNTNYVKVRQMPFQGGVGGGSAIIRLHGTAEEQLGQTQTSLSAKLNVLAITGDSFKFQLVLYPQMQVTRPNANGLLGDLQ